MIIDLTWSLIAMEEPSGTLSNPLVAKTLDSLSKFHRVTPLTSNELIKLFQINIFVKNKVKQNELNRDFAKIIPKELLEQAAAEYEKFDRSFIFADVQSDIGHKLLKLRVSYEENVSASEEMAAYTCNFKLQGANKGHIILLKGDKNTNRTTGEWLGLARQKYSYLVDWTYKKAGSNVVYTKFNVHTIDVDEWRGKSEKNKLAHLFSIVQKEDKTSAGSRRKQVIM